MANEHVSPPLDWDAHRAAFVAGISGIWGMLPDEPKDEPAAPPPINWLTHQKPLTDTPAERAAFLKKEGLACPTVITPDDVEDIWRAR